MTPTIARIPSDRLPCATIPGVGHQCSIEGATYRATNAAGRTRDLCARCASAWAFAQGIAWPVVASDGKAA